MIEKINLILEMVICVPRRKENNLQDTVWSQKFAAKMKWEIEITRVNLFFFSKKKCKIHLVELDELFQKIWASALKTACGRCYAFAKVEKHVKFTLNVQVTWLNLYPSRDWDFLKQLVELYKMYYSLFFQKKSNLPKLFQSPK